MVRTKAGSISTKGKYFYHFRFQYLSTTSLIRVFLLIFFFLLLVAIGSKAPQKVRAIAASSGSISKSKSSSGGHSTAHPWETPSWQKRITCFIKHDTKSITDDDDDGTPGIAGAGPLTSKVKNDIIMNARNILCNL